VNTTVRELVLIGSGGFAREAAEAVHALNAVTPSWNLLGFLDDDPARQGTEIDGLPVLGPTGSLADRPDTSVVVCTGRPDNYVSRRMIVERLGLGEDRYATIVHPSATVGRSCRIGAGSVLLAHVDLTANVEVGRHVAIMPQVVLTHDCVVEDYCTLGSGVRLGGNGRIAEGAYIGAGACIREARTVGELAMIGMSAVVTTDVPAERMWFGAPARDRGPAPIPQPAGARRSAGA
jgi:sugar O-acyltransferase (sialic acid O-acetyltransferase NeuD family)